ncbi:MAG: DNA mismatch repair protein MutS, partial [Bacteriovoracaceae bacterium]|nr:DNA mismatch repair protein MutS [Bacteriovoracaceae bacterium]
SYPLQWQNTAVAAYFKQRPQIFAATLDQAYFDPANSKVFLEKLIPHYQDDQILAQRPGFLAAASALAYYVGNSRQEIEFIHLSPFKMVQDQQYLRLSAATMLGLEILPRREQDYKDSLLGHLDRTMTALGSRTLRYLFLNPLRQLQPLTERQDFVAYFLAHPEEHHDLRQQLTGVRDLERILAKASSGKINSSDLQHVATSIEIFLQIKKQSAAWPLWPSLDDNPPAPLGPDEQQTLAALATQIKAALNDAPEASLDKGNLIKPGFHQERDHFARLQQNSAAALKELEEKYRATTGISNLRIKFNNITGHVIEVSKGQVNKVPADFERRQTLVNAERFISPELMNLQTEILSANTRLMQIERGIFQDLVTSLKQIAPTVIKMGKSLATLDAFQGLAWAAAQENFTRPTLHAPEEDSRGKQKTKAPRQLHITGGFHPVLAARLHGAYVAHNLHLDEQNYFGLITGPNMAGKTTAMREVAMIQFLAQIGGFVPAQQATLTLCDYIFGRLGAGDDILRGQSTFMAEMRETSEIIRHATSHSLLIMDEIGRGTSTYDGLSIAWALMEHLVQQTKAWALFSTHYHELIDVADHLPGAKNLTVEIEEQGEEIHFLYRLLEASATQSFGIYVAKLAGIPAPILARAKEHLAQLEKEHQKNNLALPAQAPSGPTAHRATAQRSFFEVAEFSPPAIPAYLQHIESDLRQIDLMATTPLQALQKLQDLQSYLQ